MLLKKQSSNQMIFKNTTTKSSAQEEPLPVYGSYVQVEDERNGNGH